MHARRLLRRLRAAGFSLRVEGEDLVVSPGSNLTEWMADLIRARKPALVDLLERNVSLDEYPLCVNCCEVRLPLGGVRCPSCRNAHSDPACASCGADIPGPNLSICDLCELEDERLSLAEDAEGGR